MYRLEIEFEDVWTYLWIGEYHYYTDAVRVAHQWRVLGQPIITLQYREN